MMALTVIVLIVAELFAVAVVAICNSELFCTYPPYVPEYPLLSLNANDTVGAADNGT